MGSTWAMSTAGRKASSGVRPSQPKPEGGGDHEGGGDEHELVGEPGEHDAEGGGRVLAHPGDAAVHGADEAGPALALGEPAAEAGVVGHEQHGDEGDERAGGDGGGHGAGPALVAQVGVDDQAEERDAAGGRASR